MGIRKGGGSIVTRVAPEKIERSPGPVLEVQSLVMHVGLVKTEDQDKLNPTLLPSLIFMSTLAGSSVPAKGQLDRAWLDARFGEETSPGWSPVNDGGEDGESTYSRTGGPTVMCWAGAREVVAELGEDRAVITGYVCSEGSHAALAEHADGHDLALVDGRFLVDTWAAHLVMETSRCVLDLADPADFAEAQRLHEPFEAWTRPPDPSYCQSPTLSEESTNRHRRRARLR